MKTKQLFEIILAETGLTKKTLADKLDIAPMRITEWLSGKEIRFSRANEICDKLGLNLCAILCKHAQSVSLEKSANECLTNNKKK